MNEIFRLVATIKTNAKTAIGELKAVEKTGKTMGARLGKTMKTLAKVMKVVFVVGAAAATYAMGKFFVSSIKSAAQYEQAMAMVQAVTGATGEEFDALGEKAKELGKTTKFTMISIAEGMEALGRAGMTANEIIDSMAGVSALAASQCIELGQAAEMTAGALNGFNLAADQAGRVADVYAYAASNSAIRTEDLAETLKYAMPAANALGYSLEDVAGMAMILGDNMIKGSMAGTGLSFAFSELVGMSDEFQKKLGDVGVSVDDLTGPDGKILSMAEVLGVLKDKGLDAGDMFELFGKRAGKSMVILLDKGEEAIKDYTGALEDCGGTAEEMAEIQLNTLSGQLEILKGSWELLKVIVGEKLIPVLKDFVKGTLIPLVNRMAEAAGGSDTLKEKFGAFFNKIKKGIDWIVEHRRGLATALKAIAVGFAAIVAIKIATWIGGAISGFTSLAGIVGVTGPLGIAIAAAAAGLVLLLRKVKGAVEEAKKKAAEAREEVKHLAETIEKAGKRIDIEAQRWNARAREMAESSKELARVFDTAVRVMGEKLYGLVETAKMPESAFHSLVNELRKAAVEASKAPVAKAGEQWSLLADAILSKYSEMYPALAEYREGYLGDLKVDLEGEEELRADSMDRIIEIQRLRWEAMGAAAEEEASAEVIIWTGAWTKIVTWAKESWEKIVTRAKAFWDEFKEITKNGAKIIQDVWSGLSELVGDTLGEMLRGAFDYFRDREQAAKDYRERMLGILKDCIERSEDLEAGHQGNLADAELQYQRKQEDIKRDYLRELAKLEADDFESRERVETRYHERMEDAEIAHSRRREDIEKDYTDAAKKLVADREEAKDDEIQAYKDSVKPIGEALWEIVKTALAAAREELWILSAVQTAKALAFGAAAALGGLWAIPIAAQHAAAGLAAGLEATALTITGAIAGFKEGALMIGPTVGVFGEGPYDEVALPLTPPILADIGKGIVSALRGVEPAYAGAGIGGAQVVIKEMHVAEGAVFHVREEADIERIAKELGDEFDDRIIGKGRVTP